MCTVISGTRKEKGNTDLRETVGFLELGNGVGADVVTHLFFCFYRSLHQPLGKKCRTCEDRDETLLVVKASSEMVRLINLNHHP